MKGKELGILGGVILVGMLLVIPLQQAILASPDTIAALGIRGAQKVWVDNVLPVLTYGIWIGGVLATLFWIVQASRSTFRNSRSAFAQRGTWWLYAGGLYLAYLILFLALAYGGSGDVAMELQILVLLGILPLDILVLFWLPTAIATPGTLRYVPPLAMKLRKLIGG